MRFFHLIYCGKFLRKLKYSLKGLKCVCIYNFRSCWCCSSRFLCFKMYFKQINWWEYFLIYLCKYSVNSFPFLNWIHQIRQAFLSLYGFNNPLYRLLARALDVWILLRSYTVKSPFFLLLILKIQKLNLLSFHTQFFYNLLQCIITYLLVWITVASLLFVLIPLFLWEGSRVLY